MPKQVDHEERRQEIAAAVVRLVTTRGIETASLRTVASEAGVSMGAVQH
jgi:TetR/AcrR family transcriptional regulator, transcriptional repressor of bet genes